MKQISQKIANFLLIITGIVLTIKDIFHHDTFQNKKIVIEYYASIKSININNLFSKIHSVKYVISSYIQDIDNLNNILEENKKLNNEITILKHKINTNEYFAEIQGEETYKQFKFMPIEIINYDKHYGIISNKDSAFEKNDLIANECGIIGKIAYNGNQVSIIMLTSHPKFLLPVRIGNENNTGVYSFTKNSLIEIKDKSKLEVDDKITSFEGKNRIPNGIQIGKIISIDNQEISIEQNKCKNQKIGFVLSRK